MSEKLHFHFWDNLDSIALSLVRAFGLRYESYHDQLNSPMRRWLDFRLRYIEPKPKKISLSDQFPKILPSEIYAALLNLIAKLSNGEDVNQHQGKGLTLYHDTSSEKKAERTDFLWAEWGIHHLHLSIATFDSDDAPRSDWLLFCAVLENEVLLIDVLPHETDSFSDIHLIQTMFRSWPAIAEHYELNGVLSDDISLTPKEIAQLRRAGVSTPVSFEGRLYLGPGMGITTASTSSRVGLVEDRCVRYVQQLAMYVSEPSCEFRHHPLLKTIGEPNFEIALTPLGMAVFEDKANIAWTLPRRATCGEAYYLGDLHDIVLPDWALKHISDALGKAQ